MALANSGGDTINSVKQAAEFGLSQKQKPVSLLIFLSDIHSLGLKTCGGGLASTFLRLGSRDPLRIRGGRRKVEEPHGIAALSAT